MTGSEQTFRHLAAKVTAAELVIGQYAIAALIVGWRWV